MTETGAAEPLRPHVPARAPTSTYRVQLTPEHGFDAVAVAVPYLSSLGVSHLYLSPILQAAPGSEHGYDVVDHERISTDLGGEEGLRRLAATASAHGLGLVVDVVPNHMAVPVPERCNRALWSVLRDGPASSYADWFDIDWTAGDRSLLVPVLGDPLGAVLDSGQIELRRDPVTGEPVVGYFDHELPVRPGTEHLPLEKLLAQQWYRLAWWRIADEELNYRRFFDVDTLAALRVERSQVFEATHRLLLDLVREGLVDGLRIDHPDGLADPGGYLERLSGEAPDAWIVVEKILAADEHLPGSWRCHGTTGYEALAAVGGLFVDAAGHSRLVASFAQRTGATPHFSEAAEAAKHEVLRTVLAAEVERVVDLAARLCAADIRLHDHSRRALREALIALLVAMPRYRAYVHPGQDHAEREEARAVLSAAVERATDALPPHRHATVGLLADLALLEQGETTDHVELCTRIQQTAVAATAKGVEDTALYRWLPLLAGNEVGGSPGAPAMAPESFHAQAAHTIVSVPATMTTLSTHDSKRGEDTRARLSVLSEVPERWAALVDELHDATAGVRTGIGPDRTDEELVWQTLVGLWPTGDVEPSDVDLCDRTTAYLVKALREAKRHTSWVEPDAAYEEAASDLARAALADPEISDRVARFVQEIAPAYRANLLGQKLVQLTMPGVPDVHQGAEMEWLAVVDPDNRRPLDLDRHAASLAHLDAGGSPRHLGEEKLLVTATALRLRRDHPDWFDHRGGYEPLLTSTEHLLAFLRSDRVAVVASRLVAGPPDLSAATIALPAGRWTDLLSGAEVVSDGGPAAVAGVLHRLPVALLLRTEPDRAR